MQFSNEAIGGNVYVATVLDQRNLVCYIYKFIMEEQPTQRQLRLMYGRSNPYQTLMALLVTAIFFILFQVSII